MKIKYSQTYNELEIFYKININLQKYKNMLYNKPIFYKLLVNKYELLTLTNIVNMNRRQIGQYDRTDCEHEKKEFYELYNKYKNVLIPIHTNYNIYSYMNNYIIYYNFINNYKNIFIANSTYAILKVIGPGEISEKKLYLYDDYETLINTDLISQTKSLFYYVSYGEEEKYNEISTNYFLYNYRCEQIYTLIQIEKSIKYLQNTQTIIITLFKTLCSSYCLSEITNLPRYIVNIYIALQSLNIGGNLIIECDDYNLIPYVKIFSYIKSLFKNVYIWQSELSQGTAKNINIIFETYLIKDTKLNKLVKKIIKDDPNIGENIHLKNMNNSNKLCNIPPYIKSRTQFNKIIIDIDNINIDKELIKVFIKFSDNLKKRLNESMKAIDTVETIINKPSKVFNIINFMTYTSLNWAKTNNIQINKYYDKYKQGTNQNILKYLLPPLNSKKMIQLKIDINSIYSVTPYKKTLELKKILQNIFKNHKNMKIIDTTANIGGDTLLFSDIFKYVYSIEYNKNTYKILKHNINIYNRKNVLCVNDDSVKLLGKLKADIVYIDAEWGDIFYYLRNNIDLYLGNLNIIDIIQQHLTKYKYFIIKVPINYNINHFVNIFNRTVIFNLNTFLILIINE